MGGNVSGKKGGMHRHGSGSVSGGERKQLWQGREEGDCSRWKFFLCKRNGNEVGCWLGVLEMVTGSVGERAGGLRNGRGEKGGGKGMGILAVVFFISIFAR